jgi:hypothetical protein
MPLDRSVGEILLRCGRLARQPGVLTYSPLLIRFAGDGADQHGRLASAALVVRTANRPPPKGTAVCAFECRRRAFRGRCNGRASLRGFGLTEGRTAAAQPEIERFLDARRRYIKDEADEGGADSAKLRSIQAPHRTARHERIAVAIVLYSGR